MSDDRPRSPLRAARGERGIAMPAVIALLFVVLLATAVGAKVAATAISEPRRDRAATEALAVAEAALDVVGWRMNKQLVAAEVGNLDGLLGEALGTLGCLEVNALGLLELGPLAGGEQCEMEVEAGGGLARATCESSLAVELLPPPLDLDQLPVVGDDARLLSRDLVCRATVRGVTRRIGARLELDVTVEGVTARPVTNLWRRASWFECSSDLDTPCRPPS